MKENVNGGSCFKVDKDTKIEGGFAACSTFEGNGKFYRL
jgi:hypothetical protein